MNWAILLGVRLIGLASDLLLFLVSGVREYVLGICRFRLACRGLRAGAFSTWGVHENQGIAIDFDATWAISLVPGQRIEHFFF